MTNHDEEILFNLKFSHDNNPLKFIPLKLGNNPIFSSLYPEIFTNNLILFNIILRSHNKAFLRTFDHFPLCIKRKISFEALHNSDISPKSELYDMNPCIRNLFDEKNFTKQNLIYINPIFNIVITPTNHSQFFFSIVHCPDVGRGEIILERQKGNIFLRDSDLEEKIEIIKSNNLSMFLRGEGDNFEKKNEENYKSKDKNSNQSPELILKGIEIEVDSLDNEIENFESILKKDLQITTENLIADKKGLDEANQICVKINELTDKKNFEINNKNVEFENFSKRLEDKCKSEGGNFLTQTGGNNKKNQECSEIEIINQHKSYDSPDLKQILNNENNLIHMQINIVDKINLSNVNKLDEYVLNGNFMPRKTTKIIDDNLNENNKVDNQFSISMSQPETSSPSLRFTRSSSKTMTNLIEKKDDGKDLLERKRRRGNKELLTEIKNLDYISNSLPEGIIYNNQENNFSVKQNNRTKKSKESLSKIDVKILPCSICLDPIKNLSRLDGCDHEFCKECIDQWSVLSNQCPLCKNEFKKIIYWDSNNSYLKLEKKVKKRKFKYEEEEEEPWYNYCDENCMVCNKNNDEHLLLVCDKCMFSICHTYCAGLDLIPDEDWICSKCTKEEIKTQTVNASMRKSGRIDAGHSNTSRANNFSSSNSNLIYSEDTTLKLKDSKNMNISSTGTITRMKNKSLNNEQTKNINIPISYKLDNNISKKNSLNLNVNVNFQITNTDKKNKKNKTVSNLPRKKIHLRNKKYNLRNSKKK